MNKQLVVFIDCGDTIVDESTQIFADNGDVLSAKVIPGADKMLHDMKQKGYRIALVADGRTASFHNILGGLGLSHLFEAMIISEEVGTHKPYAPMFETALRAMNLTKTDVHRIVMIGNNLQRDVLGANRMGMISLLLSFSPRYIMRPRGAAEVPDYVAAMPDEIVPLLDQLEIQIHNRRILHNNPV